MDLKDSIVISCAHTYPTYAIEKNTPIHRAIVGGTGNFISAKGEIISTELENVWYHHKIVLVH